MAAFKNILIGIVIGLALGLWMGVNLGKGRSVWSNPFAEASISGTASDVLHDAKKAVRDSLAD